MKKLLMAAFFLLFLMHVFAQEHTYTKAQTSFSWGITGGLNITSIKAHFSGITFSPNSLTRLTGGFYFSFKTKRNLTIQPEILYTGNGFKVKNSMDSAGNDAVARARFDYVSIPVLFKFRVPDVHGLNVYAGPQLGVLFSATSKAGSDPQKNIKSQLTSTDFGGLVGAEYWLNKSFNISVRYVFGLLNINNEAGTSIKNTGFGITVGYKLK